MHGVNLGSQSPMFPDLCIRQSLLISLSLLAVAVIVRMRSTRHHLGHADVGFSQKCNSSVS
jgi:hypothetical protein